MKTENTTINKEVAEQNNGLHPIEDTLEGLGVEKKERRRFMKALRNLVSQEIREALKAMWEDINKRFEQINHRFEQVNHRFEIMEVRFRELGKRLDRHEKRTREQLNEFRNEIRGDILSLEKRFDLKLEAIKEIIRMDREASEKRHKQAMWVYGMCSAGLGILLTLVSIFIK